MAQHSCRTSLPPAGISPPPAWDGSDLTSRTLLVHDEQGVGDALQFVRYVPVLRERGVDVVLECNSQLVRLLGAMPGVGPVIGTVPAACRPMTRMSRCCRVPHLLGARIDNVPAAPYLAAEPGLLSHWAGKTVRV